MDKSPTKNRLSKFLAASGVASRRTCEEIIFAGRVTVNGKITLVPQTLVDSNDKINVDGKNVISKKRKCITWSINLLTMCAQLRKWDPQRSF
jgi:23S rRNA pseudouridine2605 synthase